MTSPPDKLRKALSVELRAAELFALVTDDKELSADEAACLFFSAAEYAGWFSGKAGHAPFVDDAAEHAGYLARFIYETWITPPAWAWSTPPAG